MLEKLGKEHIYHEHWITRKSPRRKSHFSKTLTPDLGEADLMTCERRAQRYIREKVEGRKGETQPMV